MDHLKMDSQYYQFNKLDLNRLSLQKKEGWNVALGDLGSVPIFATDLLDNLIQDAWVQILFCLYGT